MKELAMPTISAWRGVTSAVRHAETVFAGVDSVCAVFYGVENGLVVRGGGYAGTGVETSFDVIAGLAVHLRNPKRVVCSSYASVMRC